MPALKVVVIGAGLSGLATAVSLAQNGSHVRILESTAKLQRRWDQHPAKFNEINGLFWNIGHG